LHGVAEHFNITKIAICLKFLLAMKGNLLQITETGCLYAFCILLSVVYYGWQEHRPREDIVNDLACQYFQHLIHISHLRLCLIYQILPRRQSYQARNCLVESRDTHREKDKTGINPHYHYASDTPETLDYDRAAKVVTGLAGAIRTIIAPADRSTAP
jgi:hypothetical protein